MPHPRRPLRIPLRSPLVPVLAVVATTLIPGGAASAKGSQSSPKEKAIEGVTNPPPKMSITDGFFVVVQDRNQTLGVFSATNNDGQPHMITGFSSPACRDLTMEQWDGSPPNSGPLRLTVPGKGKMVFLRGGYHLNCQRPVRELKVGDTVPVTIHFRDLPAQTESFSVKPLPRDGGVAHH